MLKPVTTTLKDIQQKLVEILHAKTILIGHSLNSDMTALKMSHPFIIDTALLYPHPRGPPLKSSLKWLAQKYLNREVQKGHGTAGAGHDSVEDSRTCLDLVKQKCEKGKLWGTSDAAGENMFKRLARTGVRYKNQGGTIAGGEEVCAKTSAIVDWGDPKKGPGGAANVTIGAHSDAEIVAGVKRAVNGDPDGKEVPGGGVDFVWGRLRELEALKGWWNNNKFNVAEPPTTTSIVDPSTASSGPSKDPIPAISATPTAEDIAAATTLLATRIHEIYTALPPCTVLIIYSGSGDPREMSRLQTMQQTFKREYRVKKWDELSVQWTDTEEQALKRAARAAREGLGFVCVK